MSLSAPVLQKQEVPMEQDLQKQPPAWGLGLERRWALRVWELLQEEEPEYRLPEPSVCPSAMP